MRPLVLAALLLSQSACVAVRGERAVRQEEARLLQQERSARRSAHVRSAEAARLEKKRAQRREAIDRAVAIEVAAEVAAESPLAQDAVVALLPMEVQGSTEAHIVDTLDALLFLELTSTGRFRFVPRRDIEAANRKVKAESLGDCVDAQCNLEIGRALAAERVLAPRLFASDGGCVVALTSFDLRTETGDWAATVKSPCDDASLREAARKLASRLEAPAPVGPRAPMTAERDAPRPPKAPPRPVFRPGG